MNKNLLFDSIHKEPDETLLQVLEAHLLNGCDPNEVSSFGLSPIVLAFRRGRMDAVRLLIEKGADVAPFGWGAVHLAVALGTDQDVQALLPDSDMSLRDHAGLTPFLLAVDIGDVAKTAMLLPFSAHKDTYRTRDHEPALVVAAEKKRLEMVEWLLASGFDADDEAEFGRTALIEAAEKDTPRIVEILLDAGARIDAKDNISASLHKRNPDKYADDEHQTFHTPTSEASSARVARLLMRFGAEINQFRSSVIREFTGSRLIRKQTITPEIFHAQKHRRFGSRNPENVAYEYWLEAIRSDKAGGWFGRRDFGIQSDARPAIWSYSRFGMSTTELPDGRWVQIAGEHEDWYDPEFCIYSDVFVFDGRGGVQIYTYPREVFPPTDFHTATLYDNHIFVIGSLGYPEDRKPGITQVMRLSLDDFSMSKVETSGAMPGWIGKHQTRLDGNRIIVWGGDRWTGKNYVPNRSRHQLCLSSNAWSEIT